jgi:glucokinase
MKTKKMKHQIILAGDIGGTKTRLGFFQVEKNGFSPLSEKTFPSKQYKNFTDILRVFIGGQKNIVAACFGVAGPVTGQIVKTTNLPWVIDAKSLVQDISVDDVKIINDLVANAYGIAVLKQNDFVTLNAGKIEKGNRALISAGTGLGQAILYWDGKQHVPLASEGGHADFGPTNSLEIEMLQYFMERFGHVSYEYFLSGSGLHHIYLFLRDSKRFGNEPEWLTKKMKREDPAKVITESANLKRNRLCSKALDVFIAVYGAAAGNLALQAMTFGGVYLGGGIAPKIIGKLNEGIFMNAFRNKGRLSDIVSDIPVKVIMNERTALLGAACCALDSLKS